MFEYAIAKLWMSWGIKPQTLAGHGVGEFVSACLAGVISLQDALSLLRSWPSGARNQEAFTKKVQTVTFKAPKVPYLYISSVTGTWITEEQTSDHSYWSEQLISATNRLQDTVKELRKDSTQFLVEIGSETNSELKNLLHTLGQLWLAGFTVDWSGFYVDENRHRIPLPTYPFAKVRHWVKTQNKVTDNVKSDLKRYLHPLLHENTSNLREQRFSSTFTGEEFFLADHIIHGQKVLPGVAYLEMARSALEQAEAFLAEDQTGIHLKNVIWARPLAVNSHAKAVHIGLFPEENGQIKYEIFTQSENGKEESVVHSQGVATFSASDKLFHLDLLGLRARTDQDNLSSERCYDAFKTMGIDYGSGHQGLESVYVGKNQVLAKLSLPSSVLESQDHYVLHPSLMDSGLQASIALKSQQLITDNRQLFLPFALQELEILGPCMASMWAWIRISDGRAAGITVQELDIDLCDDQGKVSARLKGFSTRLLEEEVSTTEIPGTLMCQPIWKEKEVPRENSSHEYSQHLILLCEIDPFGLELSGSAKNTTGRAWVRLQSKEKDLDKRYQDISIQIFETIRAILKKKPKRKILIQVLIPCHGVERLFCGLSGVLKTVHLENPKILGQVIEIDPSESKEGLLAKVNENSRCPEDTNIRYCQSHRQVVFWDELPTSEGPVNIPWKNGGVYLVTGGAGALGLIFAKEIAGKTKNATVILSGRSVLSREKQDQLRELVSLGARGEYHQVDVSQQDAVDGLIHRILEDFGQINGILHSAGVILDNFILKKTVEEFNEVLAPKVAGTIFLDQATRELDLDFFAFFSSGTGAVGNPGQSDYACANAFMDSYSHYRNDLVVANQRQGQTLSFNWPLWKDGGMTVDTETEKMMVQRTGMVPLTTAVGIQALYQGIASGQAQVMVLAGKPARIRQKFFLNVAHSIGQKSATVSAFPSLKDTPKAAYSITKMDMDDLRNKVQAALTGTVSELLKIKPEDIDSESELSEFGFDSITSDGIFKRISIENMELEIAPTIFFEYPTLRSFIDYLIEESSLCISNTV